MKSTLLEVKEIKNCGLCSGLCNENLVVGQKEKCESLGILPTSSTCSSFRLDVFGSLLGTTYAQEATVNIFTQLHGLPNQYLRTLGFLLAVVMPRTRKHGFDTWQTVYYRFRGSEYYANNYLPCKVLDAGKNFIRLVSATGKNTVLLQWDSRVKGSKSVTLATLLTESKYMQFKEKCVSNDMIDDPDVVSFKPHLEVTSNYIRITGNSAIAETTLNRYAKAIGLYIDVKSVHVRKTSVGASLKVVPKEDVSDHDYDLLVKKITYIVNSGNRVRIKPVDSIDGAVSSYELIAEQAETRDIGTNDLVTLVQKMNAGRILSRSETQLSGETKKKRYTTETSVRI